VDYENSVIEQGDLVLGTNAPNDLVQILTESFQIVIAKKIPELTLKVLKVFTQIIAKYQTALTQIYEERKDKLPPMFLIAQCNNFFTFYELLEDMIRPVINQGIATEDEVD